MGIVGGNYTDVNEAVTPLEPAKPYSQYAPDMHVSVGCIPCTRAHLSAVSAALKAGDAETAREEISALMEYDLTPEKLAATPEKDREVLAKYAEGISAIQEKLAEPVPELTAIAAALKEAIRFARADGIEHPEVQLRLERSEEHVNGLERIRFAPEKLLRLEPEMRDEIKQVLPEIREARHKLVNGIVTPDDLEIAAARFAEISRKVNGDPDSETLKLAQKEAAELNSRFRQDVLKAWGGKSYESTRQ
ncbi:hypothetical protein KZ483_17345 [Paenibacillus sp. sptzw28]|uniref:hypothetical protein n=1 Tax=Paenibacillus sp. sptzw28 TaxID=715179 RepID=UPI001C6EA64B|nr:hypothetical protein [Paenibacillus sp. sptzw28]QYR19655.1 hypothetical protein KZ483_17345 [Paenibacillus sp. sptzw28]